MKVTIPISVCDNSLRDLGIEQPKAYSPLHFNSDKFTGYWITTDDDDQPDEIIFYLGGEVFFTSYCKEHIEIFESILK